MKKIVFLSFSLAMALLVACGGSSNKGDGSKPESMVSNDPSSYDPKRGEGKFTMESLALGAGIDETKVQAGEAVRGVKCASCHKLTDEKLVGPGWKGVTSRRSPAWIMNFITNPDPMIDKDPAVQAQLELCLVRMPNQGLSDEDARNILEFMRKNDQ